MPDTEASSQVSLTPSLIGSIYFDDELYFAQDEAHETVDGYLIAMDALVDRMMQQVKEAHSAEERETIENINFYPVYNLATGTIQIEGTYWYLSDSGKETQGDFTLPLSQKEKEALICAMDAYCLKSDSKSCLEMLNDFRVEDGLSPLAPAPVMQDMLQAITDITANVDGLREEYTRKEPLESKIYAASYKTDRQEKDSAPARLQHGHKR